MVHYKVEGLGHGWPSTVAVGGSLDEYRLGPTNWDASSVIGEWFGKWSRGSGSLEASNMDALSKYLQ